MGKNCKTLRWNAIQLQNDASDVFGQYCIMFLYYMSHGVYVSKTMDDRDFYKTVALKCVRCNCPAFPLPRERSFDIRRYNMYHGNLTFWIPYLCFIVLSFSYHALILERLHVLTLFVVWRGVFKGLLQSLSQQFCMH